MKVTLIHLLTGIFLVSVPMFTGDRVGKKYGVWAGIGSGIASVPLAAGVLVLFYRALNRQTEEHRREYREKYRYVYRVLAVPADPRNILKPDGAQLMVGDYGWEARPIRRDDLIYLQGLSPRWFVVWHAGFRPDQIERIAPKPCSQYDWDHTWLDSPPPCPYPVQERETTAMGFPV
jgi:hypothetical protein